MVNQHVAYCVYSSLKFSETCLCLGREAIYSLNRSSFFQRKLALWAPSKKLSVNYWRFGAIFCRANNFISSYA